MEQFCPECPAVDLRDINRAIGDFSLQKVNLRVRPGTVLLIAGANGSGKSTLLDIITGSLEPDEGIVTIFGKPRYELTAPERDAIGCSLVQRLLPEELRVRQFIRSVAQTCASWDQEKALMLLKQFGVERGRRPAI